MTRERSRLTLATYRRRARFAGVALPALVLVGLAAGHLAPVHSAINNALANPGFELDATADSRPDSWSSSPYLSRSATQVRGGSFAGRWQSTSNKTASSYQQLVVTAGATYAFSGWVNAPTTADAFTFEFQIVWRSGAKVLGTASIKRYTDDTAGLWQEAAGATVAPAGATAARIKMLAGSLGTTLYVDDLSFGLASAEPAPTPTPTPAPTPNDGDPVLIAAGDIACAPGALTTASTCRQADTATLLTGSDAVVTLGDNQYDAGELANFQASFDPTWGVAKARMHPAPGNHEYNTSNAQGYRSYFGYSSTQPLYYSWDLGDWHVVALDSEAALAQGSAQLQWLRADLAANPRNCILAYWHHPLFSSGQHGGDTNYRQVWMELYAAGTDIVLNGHDHNYERFAPQDPFGTADPQLGIRQFVVGTGGKELRSVDAPQPNSEVRNSATFGVLSLALHDAAYDWRFVPIAGSTFSDSGMGSCGSARTDVTSPSPPGSLTATATAANSIALSWDAATDDVAVTGYQIDRDGVPLTTVAAQTSYADSTVTPGSTFTYSVRARDAQGNWSDFSAPSSASTPTAEAAPIFYDDFEGGNLTKWRWLNGLIVQQGEVYAGTWAARSTNNGAAVGAWAAVELPQAQYELYSRIRFKVVSQGPNALTLLRVRQVDGTSMVTLSRASTGKLTLVNNSMSSSKTSASSVSLGMWHEAQVRVRINGTGGETEVWLDGARIADLSLTQSLGSNPIGRVNVGENVTGRSYDVAFDDVTLGAAYVAP